MADKEKRSVYETLRAINVEDHVEAKNGLRYLSWAWAWDTIMSLYPASYRTVYENENKNIYFDDGRSAWVKVGFTVVDGDYKREELEYLPILDYKNKSIPLDKVTSQDVNTAIQRCATKAIARHGLGFYIYAGQDLPEEDKQKAREQLQAEQQAELVKTLKKAQLILQKEFNIDFRSEEFAQRILAETGVNSQDVGYLMLHSEEAQKVLNAYRRIVAEKKAEANG